MVLYGSIWLNMVDWLGESHPKNDIVMIVMPVILYIVYQSTWVVYNIALLKKYEFFWTQHGWFLNVFECYQVII